MASLINYNALARDCVRASSATEETIAHCFMYNSMKVANCAVYLLPISWRRMLLLQVM